MKVANKNIVRSKWIAELMKVLTDAGEDVGQIANNELNFPVVEGGEEAWVEIVVKVPNHNEGYEKREDFEDILETREQVKKEQAAKKAKKIAQDEKRRAEVKAKKEAEAKKKKEREEGKRE